jgi:Tol biopolymer transport system component
MAITERFRVPAVVAVILIASVLVAIVAAKPAGAAFPGKNGKMTFVSTRDGNEEIYVMDPNGTDQTRLTNNPAFDALPAFSPDGEEVAFTSRRDGNDEIYVMDVADTDGDGDNPTRITSSLVNEFQPAFSPDGQRIAFTSNQTGDNEVYVMDADGTDQVRLTNNARRDARPAFSPDGERIAFSSNRDGDDEIYVMVAVDRDGDGNGDNLTKITDNTVFDNFSNFSPDGKALAFTSRRDGNDEIYVVNSDGSGVPTRLTNNPAVDEFPAFSPDGREVAFSSNREGNFEIYAMDADGVGTPTRLTYDPAVDSKPDWGPFLYDFSGFYKPVDNLPTTNGAKAGSAVPVKFGLGGNQGLDIFAADYPKSQQIDCDSTAPIDNIEQTATAGDSGLSYDAATDQYTYVWKTDKAWSGTCRQLALKLDDSTVYRANFEFE